MRPTTTKLSAQQGIATGGDVRGKKVYQTVIVSPPPQNPCKLTRQERIDLSARVECTASAHKMRPQELWIKLHHIARVSCVDEMTESHLPAINIVLDLMDQNAALSEQIEQLKTCTYNI